MAEGKYEQQVSAEEAKTVMATYVTDAELTKHGAQAKRASPVAEHRPTQQATLLTDSTVEAAGGYE